ncbi:MAG: hypothetical protein LLG00_05840 [Planctomycetaceae bacterium]|nr:hypothetical protein [Planctomycetaceae bacterium]
MRIRGFSTVGRFCVGLGIGCVLTGALSAAPPDSSRRDSRQPDRVAQKESRDTRRDTPPPQNIKRDNPQPAPATRRDNPPPPPQNIRREAPQNPPQNIKRDSPQPPPTKRDVPDAGKAPGRDVPKQTEGPAGSGTRRDAGPDKDKRRQPDVDKGAGKKPDADKRQDQKVPPKPIGGSVDKRQPPAGDRSRIEDAKKRLDRDRGKPVVGPTRVPDRMPPRDIKQPRFVDRVKSGEVNRIAGGPNAQKLRLTEQYRLWQQGDVARRLDLEKHRPPTTVYRGVVSPAYHQHSFQYRYYGPSRFAGVHWYPKWDPWVKWSWYYRARPWWDPRPIWCRPVVYAAALPWIYWATPVWTPLPVVSCGTWVDLRPVVLAPQQADLQLVAVRFVDPGHPEERTGPRYRVWFRNNGNGPVTQPFNVMLFASNDARLAPNLPQAGVRVNAIEAGAIQSVDIRLPVDVYAMNRDAQGNPAPFATLHVLVDANREVPETTMANNGTRLNPSEILPVDPAAFQLDPVAARAGSEVTLAGEGFGPQPGRALVVVNGQEMDAEILGWYDLGVRLSLPRVAVAGPTEADVIIVRGDGAAANPLKVTISP